MTSRPGFAPLLAALLLAACGGEQQGGPRTDAQGTLHYGELAFTPCALSATAGQTVEAQCATLQAPEDHDAPQGRMIELAVALVPAKGLAVEDPVYMIAGGPGQSAIESYPQVHAAFEDVRRTRHVVLVDARGTGGSHPLACRDEDGDKAIYDPDDESPEAMRAFAERCREALSKTADLRYYTTGDHVRDLDLVRETLGVERINLVGISYGTRVAQQYAAAYPQHTRSLVLDSVVPNTLVLGQEHARNLEDALQAQFAACRGDGACLRNLGDPADRLVAVRERLDTGSIAPVRYRDPVSGEWREETPRYGHLAGLLRMYAYQPQIAATLPLLLHEAAQGHYESLLAQSQLLTASVSDAIYHGMQLSVLCSEDADELRAEDADRDTVLGTALIELTDAQCAVWPRGRRAEHFREPLRGDLPVLAISGEFDPVTPPRYGDEAIAQLSNARHLVLPGQGHNVIGTGCMPKLFAQFVENTDADALDADCLQRLQPQPPFAGAYGWEP
ncbi:alpha/beta hydrolase [Luteimonas suaedae]|uniref:alpha/beta hydrolase n=1 Tax=Luteimonas suaedae TaxID=2605430 RepID=UPI0011EC501C|nr:alpha/beta hydrolase [Luteimonas suaedae]